MTLGLLTSCHVTRSAPLSSCMLQAERVSPLEVKEERSASNAPTFEMRLHHTEGSIIISRQGSIHIRLCASSSFLPFFHIILEDKNFQQRFFQCRNMYFCLPALLAHTAYTTIQYCPKNLYLFNALRNAVSYKANSFVLHRSANLNGRQE